MPEHLRVAQVVVVVLDDGIGRIAGEVIASVGAVGHALLLLAVAASRRVECHHSIGAEAGGVVLVDDGRTGEDVSQRVARESHGLFRPVHEVGRGGVAPRHVAPVVALRVILVEEVVSAVDVDHSVRVIHPVLGGGEVYLRAVLLGTAVVGG